MHLIPMHRNCDYEIGAGKLKGIRAHRLIDQPSFNRNYNFPITLTLTRIPFGAKALGDVKLHLTRLSILIRLRDKFPWVAFSLVFACGLEWNNPWNLLPIIILLINNSHKYELGKIFPLFIPLFLNRQNLNSAIVRYAFLNHRLDHSSCRGPDSPRTITALCYWGVSGGTSIGPPTHYAESLASQTSGWETRE